MSMHLLSICYFLSMLWLFWLGDSKGSWPCKKSTVHEVHFWGTTLTWIEIALETLMVKQKSKVLIVSEVISVVQVLFATYVSSVLLWVTLSSTCTLIIYVICCLLMPHILMIAISCWWVRATFKHFLASWMKICMKVSAKRMSRSPSVEVWCHFF